MQVEVDEKCMQTKFSGHGVSGFGDFASFLFAFKILEYYVGSKFGKLKLLTVDKFQFGELILYSALISRS